MKVFWGSGCNNNKTQVWSILGLEWSKHLDEIVYQGKQRGKSIHRILPTYYSTYFLNNRIWLIFQSHRNYIESLTAQQNFNLGLLLAPRIAPKVVGKVDPKVNTEPLYEREFSSPILQRYLSQMYSKAKHNVTG